MSEPSVTDNLLRSALTRALHERAIYRTMTLAALDQLRDAFTQIDALQREKAIMREELVARMVPRE